MHSSASAVVERPVQALARPINNEQERAILDLLVEGIFVLTFPQDNPSGNAGYPSLTITYANNAFAALALEEAHFLIGQSLDNLFAPSRYPKLYEVLEKAVQVGEQQEVELVYKPSLTAKNLSITLIPSENASLLPLAKTQKNHRQIVGCVRDTTALTTRANYLEERAVKLIDHANVLESSRRDLEKQLLNLRKDVTSMERAARFDTVSGLPNRAYFLERGAAEFQRSVRYGHTMSVAVCRVQGYQQILDDHGETSANAAITGLAQMCETAFRAGTDLGGRISHGEIAIMLPETDLSGALKFIDRMSALIAATPIQIGEGYVRIGILTGIDEMQTEDHAFMQLLVRAQAGRPGG